MLRANFCVVAVLVSLGLAGCSGEEPAGPDVTGMVLPDAKAALEDAGVTATVQATDAAFGVLIEENFVVCKQEAVNANTVRLEVAKRGC